MSAGSLSGVLTDCRWLEYGYDQSPKAVVIQRFEFQLIDELHLGTFISHVQSQ
jgi:hypothetical protein